MKGPARIDLTGQRFGNWLVIDVAPNRNGNTTWHCRCDCGIEEDVDTRRLRASQSNGCLTCSKKERRKEISLGEESLTLEEWASRLNMTKRGLTKRLGMMSVERALTLPKQKGINPGRLVTVGEVTLNVSNWSRRSGVTRETIRKREKENKLNLLPTKEERLRLKTEKRLRLEQKQQLRKLKKEQRLKLEQEKILRRLKKKRPKLRKEKKYKNLRLKQSRQLMFWEPLLPKKQKQLKLW